MSFTWNQLQKQIRLTVGGHRVLVVDGLIGAGKTSLLNSLENLKSFGIRACFIKEPSDIWEKTGSLAQFYSDPKRFGIEFQVMVTATRIKSCTEAVSDSQKYDLYILERSLLTDRAIFMEIQRPQNSPTSMAMYEMWWQIGLESLPFDLSAAEYIYLKPSMDVVMDRVRERARQGEIKTEHKESKENKKLGTGGVSQEYQELLEQAHDAFFLQKNRQLFPDMPKFPGKQDQVTVISNKIADQDFREQQLGQDTMIQTVLGVIYKRWPELNIE